MGKRGPKRMSSNHLKLNGSRIEDGRGLPTPASIPIKPDWIAAMPIASRVWDLTVEDLADIPGLLCNLDTGALALYCDAWQQYRDAGATVGRCGMIATSEKGGEYQHPAVGIRNKAREAIIRLGTRFGLDPQSREGLIVTGRSSDDELEELIR